MKNILLLIADQLPWKALPVYGNRYAKTPNIDRICKNAAYFDSCYTACPLCQPSRASFWTSRYPHDTDVRSNGNRWPVRLVDQSTPTIGETFRAAGYETVHFGKTHDAGALHGFRVVRAESERLIEALPGLPLNDDTYFDCSTGRMTAEYLREYAGTKPFFVVADLVNPHNICGWIGAYANHTENPWLEKDLPPLPDNFQVDDMGTRPKAVQYICCSHNRQAQVVGWNEKKYRQYLYAYYYYMKLMDAEVGRILDALEQSGAAQNTLIVFMADHGESLAARGRVTKHVDFYEEVTRVPFIFKGVDIQPVNRPIKGLASLLDLYPTLCGLCNIPVPNGLRGEDLSGVLQGRVHKPQKDKVVSEWHTEWGFTVTPGRMLRTARYKYMEYRENDECELYDLDNDPLEMRNLAPLSENASILQQMRDLLRLHQKQTDDDFDELEVQVSPLCRKHAQGYQNHEGQALPARFEKECNRQYRDLFQRKYCDRKESEENLDET